jgi:hypothetical protein
MVPKASLELVVATNHYPYFQYFNSSLASSGCFSGSVCPLESSHTKFHALSLYIGLAHFGFVCYSPYLPADSCGFGGGVDLIEMVPMISFSASQATEPRRVLVWGHFVWITFLTTTVCFGLYQ